jgi:hypothetical protein
MQKIESSVKSAKNIVMEYLQAAERRDFQTARDYLSDNISYVGPLNSIDRVEPYLKYFERIYVNGTTNSKSFKFIKSIGDVDISIDYCNDTYPVVTR